MGPVNDPLEWIVPEQTLPPFKFNRESGYPKKKYVMRTWPMVAMNNELWFIRFFFNQKEIMQMIEFCSGNSDLIHAKQILL